jgi:predicted porin
MLMKKSLIALAVAGALTAPMIAQADATLYGSFRVGLEQAEDSDLDLVDQSSRIGIKGDVDLGLDNTVGLFHWEANVSTADSGQYSSGIFGKRLAYIGAKGDWGKVLAGRQYHPHYLLINAPVGVFNPGNTGYGERFFVAAKTLGGAVDFKRVDNSIAYYSPDISGLTVIAGGVFASNGSDTDGTLDDTVDGYNVAATYTVNGLTISGSVASVESGVEDTDVWGLAVSYKSGPFAVALTHEDGEKDTGTSLEQDATHLMGKYTAGATSVYARYATFDDNSLTTDLDQWGLGVTHVMGNGRVFAEYIDNDSDDASFGDKAQIGYRLDF